MSDQQFPDFGRHAADVLGVEPDTVIHLADLEIDHIIRPEEGLFTTFIVYEFNEVNYGLTLDFSPLVMLDLLEKLNQVNMGLTTFIFDSLFKEPFKAGEAVFDNSPINLSVSLILGELVVLDNEEFIPMVVESVIACE